MTISSNKSQKGAVVAVRNEQSQDSPTAMRPEIIQEEDADMMVFEEVKNREQKSPEIKLSILLSSSQVNRQPHPMSENRKNDYSMTPRSQGESS